MGIYARRTLIGIIVFIALLVIGALWYSYSAKSMGFMANTTPIVVAPSTGSGQASSTGDTGVMATTSVKIALLDTKGDSNGVVRGCDKVVLVDRIVPATSAPLNAALNELFTAGTTSISGWFNFIDRTSSTLRFDHAAISSSTADIYLTGNLSGLSGVCDDPRAAAQIEETALQFPNIHTVNLFLNGTSTTLIPSEKGK